MSEEFKKGFCEIITDKIEQIRATACRALQEGKDPSEALQEINSLCYEANQDIRANAFV